MQSIIVDPVHFKKVSIRYRNMDPAGSRETARLRMECRVAMGKGPYSVAHKGNLVPGISPHAYATLSRYFWPNPDTSDGLPYVRRDGETNPDIARYDRGRIQEFVSTTRMLFAAYALLGDRSYLERATSLVTTWFLDPETAMLPHVEFGDYIPGMPKGKNSGVLSTRLFVYLIDAIMLAWNTGPDAQRVLAPTWNRLQNWFAQFTGWMASSELGQKERAARNNHGTWFDVQYCYYLCQLGQKDAAIKHLEQYTLPRLDVQIAADATQPFELARTQSLMYTEFNLDAWSHVLMLGRHLGMDIWNHTSPGGKSFRMALEAALPYLSLDIAWPHQQIKPFFPARSFPLLMRAAAVDPDGPWLEAARKVERVAPPGPLRSLMFDVFRYKD